MRTLILFRHSKAAQAEPGQSDETRALTGRGRREAAEAGAALTGQGFKPDLVLVSTATRTRETAAGVFGDGAEMVRFEPGLYHAGPQALWDAFQKADAEIVAVVAHNPGLAELVSHLVREAHDQSAPARMAREDFPTSAWAAFELSGDRLEAPGARFLSYWRPKRD